MNSPSEENGCYELSWVAANSIKKLSSRASWGDAEAVRRLRDLGLIVEAALRRASVSRRSRAATDMVMRESLAWPVKTSALDGEKRELAKTANELPLGRDVPLKLASGGRPAFAAKSPTFIAAACWSVIEKYRTEWNDFDGSDGYGGGHDGGETEAERVFRIAVLELKPLTKAHASAWALLSRKLLKGEAKPPERWSAPQVPTSWRTNPVRHAKSGGEDSASDRYLLALMKRAFEDLAQT